MLIRMLRWKHRIAVHWTLRVFNLMRLQHCVCNFKKGNKLLSIQWYIFDEIVLYVLFTVLNGIVLVQNCTRFYYCLQLIGDWTLNRIYEAYSLRSNSTKKINRLTELWWDLIRNKSQCELFSILNIFLYFSAFISRLRTWKGGNVSDDNSLIIGSDVVIISERRNEWTNERASEWERKREKRERVAIEVCGVW